MLDLIKGITGMFENGLNIISIYPKIEQARNYILYIH